MQRVTSNGPDDATSSGRSRQQPAPPWRANLLRSVRLLQDFRTEQRDPARFYGALARDTVGQLSRYEPVGGRSVLDVGGGPGYFADAFEAAGARYVAVDPDAGELAGRGFTDRRSVRASGYHLPFADGAFDICSSSNVLEHVARPWDLADEMVRVTAPGGVVYLSYTVWYGPWGGHETSPGHYLGGLRARERYRRRHGREPKNRFGESLFAVTVADGVRWAREQRAGDVLDLRPRYHPDWARHLTAIPGVREVLTWNLLIVLRRSVP